MRRIQVSGLGLCLAATAAAQVTPIGPFTGDHSEGFETQVSTVFTVCVEGGVFNDNGDLCSPFGNSSLFLAGFWGFHCDLYPRSGTRFFGSSDGPAEFTFDTDVTAFGGYFATNSWLSGNPSNDSITVELRDRAGNQIDSVTAMVTANCLWTWNGWTSTTGIASILVSNSAHSGAFAQLDDMEIRMAPSTVGTNYCTANANSTGQTGLITGLGSASVAANDLTLQVSRLPNNSFGFFLTSSTQGITPNPGGSLGVLCLGGNIGRYAAPGQIRHTGTSGGFDLRIDLTQIPTPTGFVSATVGEMRNFQGWHRDSVGGVARSNFTNGLAVTFAN